MNNIPTRATVKKMKKWTEKKRKKKNAAKINQQINEISSVFIINRFFACACLLHGCHVFLFIVSLLSACAYCYQVKLIKKWCGGGAKHHAHSSQSTNGKKLILSFCLRRFLHFSSFHHHRYCVCVRCVDGLLLSMYYVYGWWV